MAQYKIQLLAGREPMLGDQSHKVSQVESQSARREVPVKPRVHVIGTGGTIGGVGRSPTSAAYASGGIRADALVDSVDGLRHIADISTQTPFSAGSEDMGPVQWLALALRIGDLVERPDVDGIVITHGTDTLEEAAFFLDLVVSTEKPIVLTGAMRPSTALSADGPANMHQAVMAAADRRLAGRGVLLAMNGWILPGSHSVKTNSVALESFRVYPGGPLGRIVGDELVIFSSNRAAPLAGHFSNICRAPRDPTDVDVIYLQAGCGNGLIESWKSGWRKGLVIAAFGAGTMPSRVAETARKAAEQGRVIVVSSRVGEVLVRRETMTGGDGTDGLIASGVLNPGKSAVLLSLALAYDMPREAIALLFEQHASGETGTGEQLPRLSSHLPERARGAGDHHQ